MRNVGSYWYQRKKQEFVEKSVSLHLVKLKGGFENGVLDEECIENVDETHFVFNMDNAKTLGFKGEDDVRYADFIPSGALMTMMVLLTGGKNTAIQTPMIVFTNKGGHTQLEELMTTSGSFL